SDMLGSGYLDGGVILDGGKGGRGVFGQERVCGDVLVRGRGQVERLGVFVRGEGVSRAHFDGGRVRGLLPAGVERLVLCRRGQAGGKVERGIRAVQREVGRYDGKRR